MCGDLRDIVEECAPDGIIRACFVVEVIEDGYLVFIRRRSESAEFACIEHRRQEECKINRGIAHETGADLRGFVGIVCVASMGALWAYPLPDDVSDFFRLSIPAIIE